MWESFGKSASSDCNFSYVGALTAYSMVGDYYAALHHFEMILVM